MNRYWFIRAIGLAFILISSVSNAQQFRHKKDTFYVDGKSHMVIRNTGNLLNKNFVVFTKTGIKTLELREINPGEANAYFKATLFPSGNTIDFPSDLGLAISIGQALYKLNFLDRDGKNLSYVGETNFIRQYNNGEITTVHKDNMSKHHYWDSPQEVITKETKSIPERKVERAEPYEVKSRGVLTIIASLNAKGSVAVNEDKLFKVEDGLTVVGKPFPLTENGSIMIHQNISPIDSSKPFWMVYRLDKITYDPEHWEFIDTDTLNRAVSSGKFGLLDEKGFGGRPNMVISRIESATPAIQADANYSISTEHLGGMSLSVWINENEVINSEETYMYSDIRQYMKRGKNSLKVIMKPKDLKKENVVKVVVNQSLKFPDEAVSEVLLNLEYREKGPQTKVLTFYIPYFD